MAWMDQQYKIPQIPAFADVVKDRRAEIKKISKANKALKKSSKAGKVAASKKHARTIIASADKLSSMWPRGTDRKALGKKATRAKSNIWKDWETFSKGLGALKKVASAVANDNMRAAKRIGKTCGGCHKKFRAKKAKKKKRM